MERVASCQCGSLRAITTGEPEFVGVCHCKECQRRAGSAFGVGAYYLRSAVRLEGTRKEYLRRAEQGRDMKNFFCPTCGTTVYWELEMWPEGCGVAVGGFADPQFPAPSRSWWERSAHSWVRLPDEIVHMQTQ